MLERESITTGFHESLNNNSKILIKISHSDITTGNTLNSHIAIKGTKLNIK